VVQKHCNQLVDKYVEYDFTIIFIDLILHKSEVGSCCSGVTLSPPIPRSCCACSIVGVTAASCVPPQVYRHLIFNRMNAYDKGIDVNLIKVAVLVLFMDSCESSRLVRR
jgi:hypothetical protein